MRHITGLYLSAALIVCGDVVSAETSEEKTGRELYEQILGQTAIYDDARLVSYVEQVGNQVVSVADTRGLKFTFTVIDDETINAFALPGGYIFVHRGLIAYLNSEAELASVLAHEVAHVTEKHHSRRNKAATGSQLLAGVLGVLTRSGDVAEATAIWGASAVSGFGREMELEADETGAEYLLAAGYEPQAMIDVISLLKDNERLQKKKDQERGRKTPNYHGLFATHPRNDKRLREIIGKIGQLPDAPSVESNVMPFRIATEGMVWGRNYGSPTVPDNVYQDEKRAFRFNIPEGWSFEENSSGVVGQPDDGGAKITILVMARTLESPDVYIKNQLAIPLLKKSEPMNQNRLKGHTGLVPGQEKPDMRLAVIYYGRNAYIFQGEFLNGAVTKKADSEILATARSFRPVSRAALSARKPRVIHYVKATSSTTFAKLAKHLKLGKFGEEELRIINNEYPVGEPDNGQWIKIITQGT